MFYEVATILVSRNIFARAVVLRQSTRFLSLVVCLESRTLGSATSSCPKLCTLEHASSGCPGSFTLGNRTSNSQTNLGFRLGSGSALVSSFSLSSMYTYKKPHI